MVLNSEFMAEFDTGDLLLPKHWQENTKRAMIRLVAIGHKKLPIIEHR